MAYNLKLTNGSTLVTISDGVSDTSYSSLSLFGKNFAGYGPLLNENQIKLLENFSNVTPPPNPLQGQLWWNSQTRQLSVRTLQEWRVVSGPTVAPVAPSVNRIVGDQWWDTENEQLNIYNGTGWSMVGPMFSATQGVSGPVVENVAAEFDGTLHTVTKFYINDVVVAVLSNDATFTTTQIPGFYSIKPGFTLSTNGGVYQYHGDAANALSLGGVVAANYLRSDVASTTNFPLSVKNDSGLSVGVFNDLNIAVQGNEIAFLNNTTGRDISFYIKDSFGQQSLALRVDGVTGKVLATAGDPTADNGVATKHYTDTLVATTEATLLRANGTTPIAGNLSPVVNGVYSLGAASTRLNSVFATTVDSTTLNIGTGVANSITINDAPSSNKSATNKEYVDNKITTLSNKTEVDLQTTKISIVGSAAENLNTLGKLAAAINNDPAYAVTINTALDDKASRHSPDLLGSPMATTAPDGDVSSRIANTAFVSKAIAIAAAAPPPETTTVAISNAISTLVATPVFTGKIIAQAGVQVNGAGVTTLSNNTLDIGEPTKKFRDVYATTFKGVSVNAQYADLAELYEADSNYAPGTILMFGGSKEVTLCDHNSTKVAGVVSTNPAYLMNTECKGEAVVALALQGRCPVKVQGPISKGDLLVSAGCGFAEAAVSPAVGTVIGKALADFEGDAGIIEVAVGRC